MIKMYTRDNCTQCIATKQFLDRQEVDYEIIDLDKEPEAMVQVEEMGYRSLPILVVDNESWSGFRPDKLSKL